MRKTKSKSILSILFAFIIILMSCNGNAQNGDSVSTGISPTNTGIELVQQNRITALEADTTKFKVTFIELGSVRCIPCQKMQPILRSIESKYGTQVNVVFHDVWTAEGSPYGQKYGIEAIPTQIFLNEDGVEYERHIGYLPEEDVINILQREGVK